MCLDFLYNVCLKTILIQRIIERDIAINVHKSSYKVPVILSYYNEN